MMRLILPVSVCVALANVAFAAEKPSRPQTSAAQSFPIDRTPPDADACYGASNEKDEDLKTGNEELVHRLLQQMLSPGS